MEERERERERERKGGDGRREAEDGFVNSLISHKECGKKTERQITPSAESIESEINSGMHPTSLTPLLNKTGTIGGQSAFLQ